jgi:hypothetical protein
MVQDAMAAIAGLGRHLPRNDDPDWLVLGRGMHDHSVAGHRPARPGTGRDVINHEVDS